MKKTIDNSLNRGNKAEIIGWGMPDYSAGVSKGNSGTFTAEYDGYFMIFFGAATDVEGNFYIDDKWFYGRVHNSEEVQMIAVPVKKGSTVRLVSANRGSVFYPCSGEV